MCIRDRSYVEQDDIINLFEGMARHLFKELRGVELPEPFQRMSWADAMKYYGSDKPDTRFGMEFVELKDLTGTWNYSSPAVTFKSDNALQKVGGVAAATAIEEKLAPYYKTTGFDAMVLTVADDFTFTMKLRRGTLKGTISKGDDGNLVFAFNAFGKINLGKVSAFAAKSGNTLTLTFDVTKLISLLKTVSSVANIKSLSTLSTLLSSYDGLYAGFKLKR